MFGCVCVCVPGFLSARQFRVMVVKFAFASRLGWLGRKLDTESITAQAATLCLGSVIQDVMALHRMVQSTDLAPGLWQGPQQQDAEVHTESFADVMQQVVSSTATATADKVQEKMNEILLGHVEQKKQMELKYNEAMEYVEWLEIKSNEAMNQVKQLEMENKKVADQMEQLKVKNDEAKEKRDAAAEESSRQANTTFRTLMQGNKRLNKVIDEMVAENWEMEQWIMADANKEKNKRARQKLKGAKEKRKEHKVEAEGSDSG